ncbi:MAG: SRPBCC family protein [Nocardioidaceae bacterium]
MAAQTTSSTLIAADPASIMAVIADFGSYPQWAKGVRSADVLSTYDDGRAHQVSFVLDAPPIRDDYTLNYVWDGDRGVTWSLVQATMLTAMEGAYILETEPAGSKVSYQLTVDLSLPILGMLKRTGEKVIIDTALKGLKHRVEKQQPEGAS